MVSRRSMRMKSSRVLTGIAKRIGNKSRGHTTLTGVKESKLKQSAAEAATKSQFKTVKEKDRKESLKIVENKQKENSIKVLTRRSKSLSGQEDSKIKSCTVLAVKLDAVKLDLHAASTIAEFNRKSYDKGDIRGDSSRTVLRTVTKRSPDALEVESGSRKSTRVRKATTKELRSILVSSSNSNSKSNNNAISSSENAGFVSEKHSLVKQNDKNVKKYAKSKESMSKRFKMDSKGTFFSSGVVSAAKSRSKVVKSEVSHSISCAEKSGSAQLGCVAATETIKLQKDMVTEEKLKSDSMECVRCGLTPAQFFGMDSEHNTICCFCSLIKPPQEFQAFLQLLKLDCCLKVLNQKNQNTLKNNTNDHTTLPKKRRCEHKSSSNELLGNSFAMQVEQQNTVCIDNSYTKTIKDKNAGRAHKNHNSQTSLVENKNTVSQASRPIRQQGSSTIKVRKATTISNTLSSSAAATHVRTSRRLLEKNFALGKRAAKINAKQTTTNINLQKSIKRKTSPQSRENMAKKRKLAENTEVNYQKNKVEVHKREREHTCNSCNSSFTMQWKLKLHELTHSDKSYPNVVLRQTEISETISNESEKSAEECKSDYNPNNENLKENVADTENVEVKFSESAIQQADNCEGNQEGKNASDDGINSKLTNDKAFSSLNNCKENVNVLECSGTAEEENDVCKPILSVEQDIARKADSNQEQNIETEVASSEVVDNNTSGDTEGTNPQTIELDSCNNPSTCDGNTTSNLSDTDKLTKSKEDINSEESDLNQNTFSALEGKTSKEHEPQPHNKITENDKDVKAEREGNVNEQSKTFDKTLERDDTHAQPEIQTVVEEFNETEGEKNENMCNFANEESEGVTATKEMTVNMEEHCELDESNAADVAEVKAKGANDEICESDKVEENSKIEEICYEENTALKSNSEHCEKENVQNLTNGKDNKDSVSNANEESSETEKIETLHCDDHTNTDNRVLSKNIKIKVSGTEVDNGNTNASETPSISQQSESICIESICKQNGEKSNLEVENSVDENMKELYNQMNMIFEGESVNENVGRKTDVTKSADDCQLKDTVISGEQNQEMKAQEAENEIAQAQVD